MPKRALRCGVVFSQFAYRRHDAEIIAAFGGYYAAVCVAAIYFYCRFCCRVSGAIEAPSWAGLRVAYRLLIV